jgi:hypothetical protein
MKKVVSLLLVVALLLSFGMVYAASSGTGKFSVPITKNDALNGPVGQILGVVQFLGYAFAIGMLIVLGIKYVMASAQEKADLKKGMLSYIIGAVMIAGAATIPGVIAGMISW